MPAYAYMRKSSVRDPSRGVSHEVQEAAVRELAGRHGDGATLVLLSDWDMSGRRGAGGHGSKCRMWAAGGARPCLRRSRWWRVST